MKFKGIMPALVTPFKSDGRSINEKITRDLLEYHLSLGADGFYICGSTGEGLLADEEKRMEMCEITTAQVNGRKPVICHVAAINMDETIRLAKHAEKAGATAISAIPPLFFHYDEKDVYKYYKTIAESTSLPFIIYNHASVNGGMSAEFVAKLFEIDNITGVKWTVPDLFALIRLKDLTNGEMTIINGPDETLLAGLASGADAGIGTTYNCMLPQYLELYKCFSEGNIEKARQIQMQVCRIIKIMFRFEIIPSIKHMCKMMGFDVGSAMSPLRQLTAEDAALLENALHNAGWPFSENK